VLLAFIAVATWESFSHAQDIVDSEADYVGSIYRDTQGLPPAVGQSIRDDLEQYVTTVSTRNGRCNVREKLLTRAGRRCANCTPPS